jgi:putative transposase
VTIAAVVLPDHLHCIWELPDRDPDFPTRWRLLKSHFSRSLAKTGNAERGRRRGERSLWQRRYWEHLIRDQADLTRHIDYVHNNPVRHNLAGRVTDWPYTTWDQIWDPERVLAAERYEAR